MDTHYFMLIILCPKKDEVEHVEVLLCTWDDIACSCEIVFEYTISVFILKLKT